MFTSILDLVDQYNDKQIISHFLNDGSVNNVFLLDPSVIAIIKEKIPTVFDDGAVTQKIVIRIDSQEDALVLLVLVKCFGIMSSKWKEAEGIYKVKFESSSRKLTIERYQSEVILSEVMVE